MPAPHDPGSLISPDTFSVYVAPAETIQEALSTLMNRHRGKILYLCGNYPIILPGLDGRVNWRIGIRRALTVHQVQTILTDADEPLILFEHDRTLYDDNADLLPHIGDLCRHKAAETGTVVLFATRPDRWLARIEPYAHRMIFMIEPSSTVRPALSKSPSVQRRIHQIW